MSEDKKQEEKTEPEVAKADNLGTGSESDVHETRESEEKPERENAQYENDTDDSVSAQPSDQEVVQEAEPVSQDGGAWGAIFNGCSKIGPLLIILAIALLSWHDFLNPAKAVYCPAEIKGITAFLHSVAQGNWVAPVGLENDQWLLPQWPGFYWFIGLIALIPGIDAWLLPTAEALAAIILLMGIWSLAITAGFGSRAALAACLVLICAPFFAPLPHFMGYGVFAAACVIWALFFFYRGWRAEHAFISLPVAFILTGLAGLSGGWLHFGLPLIASFCFLIWQGKFRRGHSLDAIIGFALMLVFLGVWFGWVILEGDNGDWLSQIFKTSFIFSLEPLCWLALVAGTIGVMPWLLSIFGVSWLRVCKDAGKTFSASRHTNGSALIWIAWIFGCAISLFIPGFHPAAILLAALLSLLLGKAILRLSSIGNPFFFILASLLLVIAGIIILGLSFDFSQSYILNIIPVKLPEIVSPTLLSLSALPIIGGILVLGGIYGFFFGRHSRQGGGLVYALLLTIILTQIGRMMIVPELAANPKLPLMSYEKVLTETEKALAPNVESVKQIESQPSMMPATKTETPKSAPESESQAVEAPAVIEPPSQKQEAEPESASVPPQISKPAQEGTIPAPIEQPGGQAREPGQEASQPEVIVEDILIAEPAPKTESSADGLPKEQINRDDMANPDESVKTDGPQAEENNVTVLPQP